MIDYFIPRIQSSNVSFVECKGFVYVNANNNLVLLISELVDELDEMDYCKL